MDEAWKTPRRCRLDRGGDGIRIAVATVGSNIAPFNPGPTPGGVASFVDGAGTDKTKGAVNKGRETAVEALDVRRHAAGDLGPQQI